MIATHRGAFEYDWRTRFGKPLSSIGTTMTWGEALRLLERLGLDPASHVRAAVNGWSHPVDLAAMVAMDTYDLTHFVAWRQGGSKGSKPKPYPRPWSTGRNSTRTKPDESLSHEEIVAALRAAGHTAPIPERR